MERFALPRNKNIISTMERVTGEKSILCKSNHGAQYFSPTSLKLNEKRKMIARMASSPCLTGTVEYAGSSSLKRRALLRVRGWNKQTVRFDLNSLVSSISVESSAKTFFHPKSTRTRCSCYEEKNDGSEGTSSTTHHDDEEYNPNIHVYNNDQCIILPPDVDHSCTTTILDSDNQLIECAKVEEYDDDFSNDYWFSKDDTTHCRNDAMRMADVVVQFRPEFKEASIRLLNICVRGVAYPQQQQLLHQQQQHTNDAIQNCQISYDHDDDHATIRGLESMILPILKVRQQYIIKTFLMNQKRFQSLSPNLRSRMMALQYGRWTQYASQWAQYMAQMDCEPKKTN